MDALPAFGHRQDYREVVAFAVVKRRGEQDANRIRVVQPGQNVLQIETLETPVIVACEIAPAYLRGRRNVQRVGWREIRPVVLSSFRPDGRLVAENVIGRLPVAGIE